MSPCDEVSLKALRYLDDRLQGQELRDLMQGGVGFVQPKDKPTAGFRPTCASRPRGCVG